MNEVVLVTGGSGYIGSHTTAELIQAGYNVIILDNLSNSEESVIDGIKKITGKDVIFEKVDCCDKESLEKIFNKYSFTSIIHFAANKAVGESVKEPLMYYSNNVESLINILEMMRKYNVENIVFSSSCTVYGQPEILPATEETPRTPAMSPYGNTKQICEDILRDSISAYQNIKGIALRYFNPIGAHPSALIGELPRGIPNNLVPFITQTAAGIRPTLNIFGDNYNTPDGTCIRDYINVVDLAKAHVVAVNRMVNNGCKKNYEVFNIGTGHGVSTLEIVKAFEKANNIKLNYKIVERRSGDIEAVWADTTFANKELGWKAEKTLEETLVSAWSWEKHLRNI
ncbi:MAG: UDP-glucose 4-epimerase GalE [Bacteroidales bacterium]|nr:UDP-glucose 4-epimerase GalE [Bacteroidales bacterium]